MRYGGKAFQSIENDQERFAVVAGHLLRSIKVEGGWSIPLAIIALHHDWIMGSWVEVKG
jgi:hypothetical protein